MKFWSTIESDDIVGDDLNKVRKVIEDKVNQSINQIALENQNYQEWKWAFIAICINPDLGLESSFPEIIKKNKHKKVLEFRIKLEYHNFVNSNEVDKQKMYLNLLHKCINHQSMEKWGFTINDRKNLNKMLDVIEKELMSSYCLSQAQ